MNQTTERGYGARIGNAAKLLQALQSFDNYQPQRPELSTAGIHEQIEAIKNLNNEVATKKQAYSLAVENRLQILEKNPESIEKMLSLINATVKAAYGRNTTEALLVAGIIKKMRGHNSVKSSKVEANTISQSHQSYHSKTQFFADLIANIGNLGVDYNPVNPKLSITALKTLYDNAVMANKEVTYSYVQFSLINSKRIDAYSVLSKNTARIKESVKAQYGSSSTEYRIVKSVCV